MDQVEISVVRRIFHLVGKGETLYRVKRTLELDGVTPPANGNRGGTYWSASHLRRMIQEDVYRPHTYAKVAEMVSSEVAARLDEAECYGIFWFNRTRTTRKRESVSGPTGREYRWRYTVRKNPRDQWVAIPVPHSGIPCEVVDTARAMIKNNRAPGKTGRRLWQIPSGAVCCEGCGTRTLQYAAAAVDRIYPYYKCSRLVRNGLDGCFPERVKTNHRAEEVERRVWEFVSDLMKDPEELQTDLERMIELEKQRTHGDHPYYCRSPGPTLVPKS